MQGRRDSDAVIRAQHERILPMAKDTDDRKTEGEEADIGLDMSQTAVKKMIAEAGHVGTSPTTSSTPSCRPIRSAPNRSRT
jgi:hypothetical protein